MSTTAQTSKNLGKYLKKVNMKHQTYEQIVDMVNYELSKSMEFNCSLFHQIDKKLKIPAGSPYEISGWKDSLDYESKTT